LEVRLSFGSTFSKERISKIVYLIFTTRILIRYILFFVDFSIYLSNPKGRQPKTPMQAIFILGVDASEEQRSN